MCYFPFHFTAQKAHRNSYCLEAQGMEKRKKIQGMVFLHKSWYTWAFQTSTDDSIACLRRPLKI